MSRSQIIKDLANGITDIETALKRAKVILSELYCKEILDWINYELQGYPEGVEIPEYRKVSGNLKGSYFKGSIASHIIYNNIPLPLGDMPEDGKEALLTCEIRQSIAALKSMTQIEKTLVQTIPAEYYPFIAKCNNDMYMNITSAYVELSMPTALSIVPNVENRLLDILICLEGEFGILDDLDIDVKSKSGTEIKDIINRLCIIVYNDQHIEMGDKNKVRGSSIGTRLIGK